MKETSTHIHYIVIKQIVLNEKEYRKPAKKHLLADLTANE